VTREIISLESVSVSYRSGPFWNQRIVPAVNNVSLSIAEGEILGLVGESGSGKTTIGRLCLGLVQPDDGSVLFRRQPLDRQRGGARGRIATVLQHPEWALNPRLTVGVSVTEPLAIQKIPKGARTERAAAALRQVGLDPTLLGRYPHELSGGQRQRISIARALITDPEFVVFDEAVSALDVSVQAQVLNLIKTLQAERGFCALFISHDLAATRYVADRIAVMRDGSFVETGPASRFYDAPESEYSRKLWSTAPKPTAGSDDRESEMPTVQERFAGFAAHPPDRRHVAFDFPGLKIGTAEYEEGPTGCTVLAFDQLATCASDIRGGSPGFLGGYAVADAISFAGGSLYGLEAATGVASEILKRRGNVQWGQVACVQSAIIYDFGARATILYPDKALGAQAWREAKSGGCPVGQVGAGRLATVGKLPISQRYRPELGGQGAAFREFNGVKILVVTVVNALGVVIDKSSKVIRGLRDTETGRRMHPRDIVAANAAQPAGGNTTVTALVINRKMDRAALTQLARQVHASMARAIHPFHTMNDGDVLFALSTGAVEADALDDVLLGELACDVAWDAVVNAVQSDADRRAD
jgi:ABC-type oligopeptide transport system ATPase subunit/L-aminopeptidase/D-esterase-like protein